MEDTYKLLKNQHHKDGILHFVGLFDGHYGVAAANFCSEYLHTFFFEALETTADLSKALQSAFQRVEKEFIREAMKLQTEAGACAVVAVICGSRLIVANVGDRYGLGVNLS